jgi:hypothetical protein
VEKAHVDICVSDHEADVMKRVLEPALKVLLAEIGYQFAFQQCLGKSGRVYSTISISQDKIDPITVNE